jgi:hypothetical protein
MFVLPHVPPKTLRLGLLLISLSVCAACGLQPSSRHTSLVADAGEAHQTPPPGEEELPIVDLGKADPSDLFDPDSLRTFELRLDEDDLAFIDADPKAEQYVPGELIFEGQRIKPVGIRYKGSTGSFVGCLSGSYFPPTGSKICPKLGMKIKIDYGDPDAKFYGQKKLLFHAMNADRSLMRERLGYWLYDKMGVHSSRTVHVRLLVNGQFVGLFLLVEEVDGRFTRSRFDDGGNGNLYKEVWPVQRDAESYRAALETNRDDAAPPEKVVAFAEALAAADDDSVSEVITSWMDTDYVARFIAVDRTIRHDDGPFHWYCQEEDPEPGSWHGQHRYNDNWCGNHNYYWYEDAKADRLWPVPWDLDGAMPVRPGFTNVASRWDDLSYACSELLPGVLSGRQMPITCDPLQRGWAIALREQVRAAIAELINGPLAERVVDRNLTRWARQIEDTVAEASSLYPREPNLATWRTEMEALRTTLGRMREEARRSILPADADAN